DADEGKEVLSEEALQAGESNGDHIYFDDTKSIIPAYELLKKDAITDPEFKEWCVSPEKLAQDGEFFAPEYFGGMTPPATTPWGDITESQEFYNGISMVNHDGEWALAVHQTIAKHCLSEMAQEVAAGGIVLGLQQARSQERLFFIGDDVHSLCIGATRSGKSRTVVLQSIGLLALAGESLVISDPKAELFHYSSVLLEKLGYEVFALDFRHPEKSHHYNLLQPIIDATLAGDQEQAEMLAWDMTNVLVGKAQGEKIWTNGEMSVIAASILSVVWDNVKRPEFQNMTNVYWFLAEMNKQIGNKTTLQ
ncbi:hypothetical protein PC120_g26938, partial [Phytophthora cactorum]